MRSRRILMIILITLSLIWAGVTYAFVFDCEPLTAEQHYQHEREAYNHENLSFSDWDFRPFPTFETWLAENQQREDKMHQWLANIADKAAEGSAIAFDPWYDTRESQGGSAPDNWNRGEMD